MRPVAALFCRGDSIYKTLPDVDVWDKERNALNWQGGCPVVAHPPCRGWGRLAHFSNATQEEKDLAPWAVHQVQKFGGVLEHPWTSKLWKHMNLPEVGRRDKFGGFTLNVPQFWFGHKAEKNTSLYVCGLDPKDCPGSPFKLGEPEFVVCQSRDRVKGERINMGKNDCRWKPEMKKTERDYTPLIFALWLVDLARLTKKVLDLSVDKHERITR
jgi:hypothetical protein